MASLRRAPRRRAQCREQNAGIWLPVVTWSSRRQQPFPGFRQILKTNQASNGACFQQRLRRRSFLSKKQESTVVCCIRASSGQSNTIMKPSQPVFLAQSKVQDVRCLRTLAGALRRMPSSADPGLVSNHVVHGVGSRGGLEMKDHLIHPRNQRSPTDKRGGSDGRGQGECPGQAAQAPG